MKHDIRTMVDKCEPCQRMQPSKPIEPFITTSASFPMEQISIDLFHVVGKTYMATADRFSGYLWVDLLRSQGTKAITDVVDKITRILSVPLRCRTDGGPQFRGPFDEYCKSKGIVHETSSPYNPRSNGHVEAAVKAAKHLLLKTSPAAFPAALAAWRNMAREDKPSPNELMFYRKIRDGKAIMSSHLEVRAPEKCDQQIPRQAKDNPIHEGNSFKQASPPQNRDAQCQRIPEQFNRGDRVRVQNPHTNRWDVEAVVTCFSRTNRSLQLLTDNGFSMWRNDSSEDNVRSRENHLRTCIFGIIRILFVLLLRRYLPANPKTFT